MPQPSGVVTFVFTDIEGSTRLLEELGVDAYREALGEHRRIVREACGRYGGYEVDYEGDAFFYAFATAPAAVAAVSEAMSELEGGPIRIRVGIHTGQPELDPPKYVGLDVHHAARVMSAAHGGQVVLSPHTAALLDRGSAELVGLGSHRLKDFGEPVALFQLGEGSFPPLKTIANTNLPTPVSSFVGRGAELVDADRLLRETRLLTITGPGGAGKTRFAVELAHRVREDRFGDYPEGVFACFLSSLRDPELVIPTIAHSLSLREQPGADAWQALVTQLEQKRLLLLLDNLEHLLDVAGELSRLLNACPGLSLLCTSRERQRLQGETVYRLPPLGDDDSVTLVCDRAQTEPTPAIAQLCRRLEGLPLALELAAARLSLLNPEQLLERLSQRLDLLQAGRDADPRQQTLRATIHWSYDLLDESEQQLFARLAAFAGGCTLEAAEQVCDARLDSLHSLIDKSLLRFDDDRYWMLETIREYATEHLEANSEASGLHRRHAEYYVHLAEEVRPRLLGSDQLAGLELLDAEQGNLRVALSRLHDAGAGASMLRLAGTLGTYWYLRSRIAEGRAWLEEALPTASRATPARARALLALSILLDSAGEYGRSGELAEESVRIYRELADQPESLVNALNHLGNVLTNLGDYPRAEAVHGEALALNETLGEASGIGLSLSSLSGLALTMGAYERALLLAQDAVRHIRDGGGNPLLLSVALANWGCAASTLGHSADAVPPLRESLTLLRDVELPEIGVGVLTATAALVQTDDPSRAATLLGCVDGLCEENELSLPRFESELLRLTTEALHERIGAESVHAERVAGHTLGFRESVDYALQTLDRVRSPV